MKNDDSFDLELEKFNSGNLPDSHIFNLGKPGEILQNCGFPAVHRIELAAARLRMKANQGNHPFEILDIQGLAGALQKPVAVFEYGDKNKSQNVIVNIEKDGKNFLVGVFFNQIRDGFEVSSIRGLFNRDNMDWMHWIQQGKMIYGNKEKIQVLAEQQRTNLADVHSKEARTSSDSYYLDSVDNILQSFGDVKDIYTKDFPKYAEQKERFEIFKKFRSAYQEVNAINALNAVQEADEFYDALKSNNKEVIARYTDAFKYPALADTAKSIIEERSFSQKEKSQEIQYAEHLMAQGLDSLDSNKILHQTNSLDNKTTSTLVIDSNQAARIKAAREIKENMPNLSEKERAAAIAILEAGAKSQDMEFSEYVEKTFPDGIFGDIEKAENAAKQQGVKINGAVSVNGFGENVRAVIYAGKNADFSTWCHELSHIWQAQLTGELKQNAEEAFQVKDSDWQNSIYTFKDGHTDTSAEAFAYGFEDFLKNKAGEMAAEDKKKIFEKFADYMSRTYNGIKQHIEINEKIASVYQKFVELDDNILAQAEKAVQMEKNAKLGIPEAERQRESVKKLYQDTDKWLKAPNGNQTKLSEEQWIAVRTPNFKRWFGNWEFNENKIVKTVELNDSEVEFNHNNAREVEKWLKENLSGKSIIIDSSGAKVLIFNKGLKDSLKRHGEIQRNSYAVLEDLISKSELFDFIKSDGKSKHNGLLGQDVYYSALKVGNNYYSVQFKFDVSAKYRTDSYKDHKIMEIKTAPLLYHGSKDAHAITSAVHDFTISQLTNGVKPNFSKMLDENGEPLVVYHGSPNKGFDVFDKNKIGSTTDYGIYGKGFYFSNKKNQAELYGDTVDVFLNIRKPFVLTDYHSPEQIADELDAYPEYFSIQNERVKPIGSFAKQGFVSYLEAKNYDGVIVKQTESTNEIVSFYANQIKSSIDNNGNFDINNDSILFQTAYHGSGANFDKFNTSEYGWSGEGYMTFGYGTYVTDSESIAKDYASAQGKREPGKRNFYTVEIPDGNYLKWEKKVGVRTIKKVATELENLGIKNISFIRKDFRDWPLATQLNYIIHNESMTNKGSGKDLYITVGSILHSPADKETSKFFKDIGFSGIEYPAGTFSGERQNAVNYVIFDDNDIKIKNHFQFQIIGELGARELDRNAESNERIANLETAKRMEEAEKDANAIRLATGWEKGADGKWKYEIDDSKVHFNLYDAMEEWDEMHPRYEELREKFFKTELSEEERKEFDQWVDERNEVSDKHTDMDFSEKLLGKTFRLPEVMRHNELFKAYPELKYVTVSIKKTGENGTLGNASYEDKHINLYRHEKDTDGFEEWEKKAGSVLLHEVQHIIQGIEGFAKGASPEMFEESPEASEQSSIGRKIVADGKSFMSAMEAYRASAGEVESRNVQTRMRFTPKQRINTLLSDTADIAPKDQIVMFDVPTSESRDIKNTNEERSVALKATAADFQQIEPALQKKFDKLKAAIKSREEQDIQDISAAEEPGNKKQAIRSKSDIIRQAGKDFLKSVKEGIAPFFNAEDDFQRIIMHPQAIINASNGLPFSGESQLLAQIYHQRQRMEGEVVTSIAGAKAAGTIVLDTSESRQKNFALTDTSSLAEKNAIVRTRYFMPESCEEPDKIYAHTLQRQRPDKIRSYRDLIRHFENIPNGQKEISDIRIRIAHEHLKEIQSRFAIKEKRVLSVDEIEERKNFLRNYFERLPADYRNSERSAFEDTFGIQLNSEKNLEINLQRDFKDIDFAELKKNTKKSIELENRKLSDFIEKNTMEDKKLATLLSDEYKSLSKEEKMTVRNLKIEAIGIKEPETFLGKYLAACNTNAEFITDKETVEEVKKNLVKKLEENFKLEKYDILKEIGQQAQSIGNETTKKISFEKAHSNNKSLEKTQSPDKKISLIGMGK